MSDLEKRLNELPKDVRDEILKDAYVSDHELEERFDDLINECHEGGDVKIWGLTFEPCRVLKELDPVAYRCGLSDYISEDDNIIEIGCSYYFVDTLTEALEKLEDEGEGQ